MHTAVVLIVRLVMKWYEIWINEYKDILSNLVTSKMYSKGTKIQLKNYVKSLFFISCNEAKVWKVALKTLMIVEY